MRTVIRVVIQVLPFSISVLIVGALLATTVVAVVGQKYGFEYGFGLAGLGMLAVYFIFWGGRKKYAHVPNIGNITEAGRENMARNGTLEDASPSYRYY